MMKATRKLRARKVSSTLVKAAKRRWSKCKSICRQREEKTTWRKRSTLNARRNRRGMRKRLTEISRSNKKKMRLTSRKTTSEVKNNLSGTEYKR